jgi:C-terminal processing protease CtpA/Prc
MSEHEDVMEAALTLLNDEYIFPEKAAEADKAVRRALAAGGFDGLDGLAFCKAVTAVFYEVCADKHLRLLWSDDPQDEEEEDGAAMSLSLNHGFQRVERLEGNVGYLDLRLVPAPQEGAPLFASAMRLLAGTEALILDLRKNIGGSTDTVGIWCSYFLGGGGAVHLNDVYTRKTDETRQYWTVAHVDGPRYPDKPVYVLTSSKTFSGAEELAYNLKVNGRATLVGETTGGGAHPTEWYPITPHITFTAPYARSINPITATNWEGVGVQPHVAVAADGAFDVAYQGALSTIGAAR